MTIFTVPESWSLTEALISCPNSRNLTGLAAEIDPLVGRLTEVAFFTVPTLEKMVFFVADALHFLCVESKNLIVAAEEGFRDLLAEFWSNSDCTAGHQQYQ